MSESEETLSERNRAALIRGFARFGVDTDGLLRELAAASTGLDPGGAARLLDRVYAERMPAMSAVFVGAETPFGVWEVIDFLAACYPTVGESFSRIGRHFRLIKPDVEFVIGDGAGGALPFVEFRHGDGSCDAFFDDYCTGIFLAHYRAMSRRPLRLAALHTTQAGPDPALRAELERYLGCAPTCGARHGRLVFARADWDAPLVGANARLRATLEAHASALYVEASRDASFGERVRGVVAQLLRGGEPRVGEVAQRLGMTARTLQRRLQDEALAFQALVDDARLQLARRYLSDPALSIAEVSFALGYSEPSAFTRAFKRWSGSAPAEYREAARAGQSPVVQ